MMAMLPKIPLGYYPTPFEELKRLSKELNGPRIWIKRDDLTGLGFGGSKTRSLENLIGQALHTGADTVITCGPVTSNHARLTATAARRVGLSCVLVLKNDDPSPNIQGNLLLEKILGAEIVFSNAETLAELEPIMEEAAENVMRKGKKPYIIPGGGYSPIGAAGYIGLVEELLQQAHDNSIKIDAVIFASGSGCIQSGLIVGNALLNADMKIIGLTINRDKDVLTDRIQHDVQRTFGLLGLNMNVNPEQITVLDDYRGPVYAVPTTEGMKAIKYLAELEGVILDPCYTGKAMAGTLHLAQKKFRVGENIVFIHTGGTPGVFAYNQIFADW